MFKSEAKLMLIKDITLAVIAWIVGSVLFAMTSGMGIFCIIPGLFVAGVPFGWRWLSNIFVAVSLQGIVAKLLGAIFLGWIAIFVVLIRDIIDYKNADDDIEV